MNTNFYCITDKDAYKMIKIFNLDIGTVGILTFIIFATINSKLHVMQFTRASLGCCCCQRNTPKNFKTEGMERSQTGTQNQLELQ